MLKAQADDPTVSTKMRRKLGEAWRKLGSESLASDVAREYARQLAEKSADKKSYECAQAKSCNLTDDACKAECGVAITDAEVDGHLAELLDKVDMESIAQVVLEAEVADFIVAGKSEISEEIITVGGFFIDKHEVHWRVKTTDPIATPEQRLADEKWNANIANEPRQDITWHEAKALCAEAGKRLCSELEWEKACKGPNNDPFGYGAEYTSGTCLPSGFKKAQKDAMGNISEAGDKVDTRSACTNEWGVFGLSGGIREWTATGQGNNYVVKPGTIGDDRLGTRCAGRDDRPSSFAQVHIGARCCADPEGTAPAATPEAAPAATPEAAPAPAPDEAAKAQAPDEVQEYLDKAVGGQ